MTRILHGKAIIVVEVYHCANPLAASPSNDGTHVASVWSPYATIPESLEFAWRWTQNIDGSWSRYGNSDWHENVKVRAALPIITDPKTGPKEYGLRSSMMGDRFIINSPDHESDGEIYMAVAEGFEKIGQVIKPAPTVQ